MTTETLIPEAQVTSLGFRGRFVPSDDPDVLIGETWVAPGGGAGPLHRHLRQTERFDVLEGAITVRLGRERRVVGPGRSIFVPAGAPHTFVNHTDEEAHFRTYFSPLSPSRPCSPRWPSAEAGPPWPRRRASWSASPWSSSTSPTCPCAPSAPLATWCARSRAPTP